VIFQGIPGSVGTLKDTKSDLALVCFTDTLPLALYTVKHTESSVKELHELSLESESNLIETVLGSTASLFFSQHSRHLVSFLKHICQIVKGRAHLSGTCNVPCYMFSSTCTYIHKYIHTNIRKYTDIHKHTSVHTYTRTYLEKPEDDFAICVTAFSEFLTHFLKTRSDSN